MRYSRRATLSASGCRSSPSGQAPLFPRRRQHLRSSTSAAPPRGRSEPVPRCGTVDAPLCQQADAVQSPPGQAPLSQGGDNTYARQPQPHRRVDRASLSQDAVQSTRHSVSKRTRFKAHRDRRLCSQGGDNTYARQPQPHRRVDRASLSQDAVQSTRHSVSKRMPFKAHRDRRLCPKAATTPTLVNLSRIAAWTERACPRMRYSRRATLSRSLHTD